MLDQTIELTEYLKNTTSGSEFTKLIQSLGEKQRQLVDLIVQGEENEDAIYLTIYGEKDQKKGAFEKLKQRLYYELIRVFFIPKNPKKSQKFDYYRNKSIEYTGLAKIISATPCKLSLDHLLRVGLKFSKKSDMTENIVELLKIQLNIHGSTNQNNFQFNKTYAQFLKYQKRLQEETEIQINYWRIYSLSKSNTTEIDIGAEYIDRLHRNIRKRESLKLTIYSYQTLSVLFEREQRYKELLELAINAIAYIDSRPYDSARLRRHFIRRKYTSCLKLKKYDELGRIFNEYFDQIPKYSIEWFLFKSYDTMLLLHNGQYELANSNLPKVSQRSKVFAENVLEFYRLVQGYAKVLHNVMSKKEDESCVKFRIFKLLNQLPIHSQEKAGLNIAIINLQIIHAIDNRDYDMLIDRADALKQYLHRHLKQKKAYRSYCFVRMIIEMTKAGFNPIRTERYVAGWLVKLKSVPLELSEQPLEVEIVPYEDLWEIIMKLLERNSKIKRGRPSKKRPE
jgi:transcription antitermination factor NusG